MGGGAGRISTWSDGSYAGASNDQDDLAIITSQNGFDYRKDDHRNDLEFATPLRVTNGNRISGSGIIERSFDDPDTLADENDVDYFWFQHGGGPISLDVRPFEDRPNLDVWAGLYDEDGDLIVQSAQLLFQIFPNPPAPDPSVAVSTELPFLPAGKYFLKVDGVGSHAVYDPLRDKVYDPAEISDRYGLDPSYTDPWTEDPAVGYSDYASLGQYWITGTITPPSDFTIDIVATDAVKAEGNTNDETNFVFTLTRNGPIDAATNVDYIVLPANPTAQGGNYRQTVNVSDFRSSGSPLVDLPSGFATFEPGQRTTEIAITVLGDTVYEPDEYFEVMLFEPVGQSVPWSIGQGSAIGIIQSDENQFYIDTPSVAISFQDESDDLGANFVGARYDFRVIRGGAGDGALDKPIRVPWSVDSSAFVNVPFSTPATPSDFVTASGTRFLDSRGNPVFPSGTLIFGPGELEKTVSVYARADRVAEGDESFHLVLGNPSYTATPNPGRPLSVHPDLGKARAIIANDDVVAAPTLSVEAEIAAIYETAEQLLVLEAGDVAIATRITVTRDGDVLNNPAVVTIALTGDTVDEAFLMIGGPPTDFDPLRDGVKFVTIEFAANQQVFDNLFLVSVEDDELDGPQTVTLTATAEDHVTGVGTAIVHDTDGTALDRYVAKPDDSYEYTLVNTIDGVGYTTYIIDMTSQTWRTAAEVDRPVWQHWVQITVPDNAVSNTALLVIDGGSRSATAPTEPDLQGLLLAQQTGQVTILLPTVPNQPLVFADDPGNPRVEDAIIAYSYDKYLDGGDDEWPALLPMVKSAVRAMDTTQDFLGGLSSDAIEIEDFFVTGASKRGWTTWLTAAVDDRVSGIAPAVIDVLNMDVSMTNHRENYEGVTEKIIGGYAENVHDYTEFGIFDRFSTPEGKSLGRIVDPYQYRDRYADIPKYIVNSTGDQFFTPDSSLFYFDDLPGEKYLWYVPNTDHRLNQEAAAGVASFVAAVDRDARLPVIAWDFEGSLSNTLRVTSDMTPVNVQLWQATRTDSIDFRTETDAPAYTSTPLSRNAQAEYVGTVPVPTTGGTAFFVELSYLINNELQRFTTQLAIAEPPRPQLVGVNPSLSPFLTDDLSESELNLVPFSPTDFTFQFNANQELLPDFSGIQIFASGGDGTFDDGNEVLLVPESIGFGDNRHTVIANFAQPLAIDRYRILITGTDDLINGVVGLRNFNNDPFQASDGSDSTQIDFDVDHLLDYGDAPESYGTLAQDGGASHNVLPNQLPRLGNSVDFESNGQPIDLDDATGDDEDGVLIGTLLDDSGAYTVFHTPGADPNNVQPHEVVGALNPEDPAGSNVIIHVAGEGFLDGWIDFDQNGTFDPNEQVFESVFVSGDPISGDYLMLNVVSLETALAGETWMRLRISRTGGLGPTGNVVGGEVEDHRVEIHRFDQVPVGQNESPSFNLSDSIIESPEPDDATPIIVDGFIFDIYPGDPTSLNETATQRIESIVIEKVSGPSGLMSQEPQVSADGQLILFPFPDAVGSFEYSVTLTDDHPTDPQSTIKSFVIHLRPVNDPIGLKPAVVPSSAANPVDDDDSYSVAADGTITYTLREDESFFVPLQTESNRVRGLGLIGDSLTDEYINELYGQYALNWISLVGQNRGDQLPLGEYRPPTTTPPSSFDTPWGDLRRAGYQYNWALAAADSFTLLDPSAFASLLPNPVGQQLQGQHLQLADAINDGYVSHAVLAIGQNDFSRTREATQGIYSGTWTEGQIMAHSDQVLANIEEALKTIMVSDVKVVLSNIIDYDASPAYRDSLPLASGRALVTARVDALNDRIEALALAYGVPLVDSFQFTKDLLGGSSFSFGGVEIVNQKGIAPTNAFVHDGIHPHTIPSAIIANAFMNAVNVFYGVDLNLFTEAEVLDIVDLDYVADTLNIQYSDYLILPGPPVSNGSSESVYNRIGLLDVFNVGPANEANGTLGGSQTLRLSSPLATAGAVATGQGGTLTPVPGGWQYTPPADFDFASGGVDWFDYEVSDDGTTYNFLTGSLSDDHQRRTGRVEFVIAAVNDPPTIDVLSDIVIDEDVPTQAVVLSGITTGGGESQPLRITATSSNPALIADPTVTYTSANPTGSLAFTPIDNQYGVTTITVTVTDGGLDNNLATTNDNAVVTETFTITVNPINDPPTLDGIGNLTVGEDGGPQTVNLTGITAGGGESQTLIITATSDNPALIPDPTVNYTSDDATGSLVFASIANHSGSATITVTVDDGATDGIITRTFTVTVNPINDLPTLAALADLVIDEDASQQTISLVSISAGGGESQPLQVTAVSSNPTLIANPIVTYTSADSTGSLSFIPLANQHGTATITVTVIDGGLDNDLATSSDNGTVVRTLTVTVKAVNDLPTINPLVDFVMNEDAPVQTVNLAGISVGGGESQPLRVTATSSNPDLIAVPSTIVISPTGTGALPILPAADQNGTATITVTVTDGGLDGDIDTIADNGVVVRSFIVTVHAINDAPRLNTAVVPSADVNPSDPSDAYTVASGGMITYQLREDGGQVDGSTSAFFIPMRLPTTAGFNRVGLLDVFTVGPANESQTLSLAAPLVTTTARGGTLTPTTGGWNYVPPVDFNFDIGGVDSFTYSVTDDGTSTNAGGTFVADPRTRVNRVELMIAAVNDAPSLAIAGVAPSTEDAGVVTIANWATGVVAGPVAASDEVAQSLEFEFTLLGGDADLIVADSLTATINPSTRIATLTYQSAPDASGTATYQVVLKDDGPSSSAGDRNVSAPLTFQITVDAVNDPPRFDIVTTSPISIAEDSGPFRDTIFENITPGGATDESSQTVSFEIEPLAAEFASLFSSLPTIDGDGVLTFAVAPNANTANPSGPVPLRIVARDSDGGSSDVIEIQIEINEVADPPLANSDSLDTDEDTVLTFNASDLMSNDSDPDLQTNAAEVLRVQLPAQLITLRGATLLFDADTGQINYDPTGVIDLQGLTTGQSIVDSFTYSLIDAADQQSNTTTVTIMVTGTNDAPTLVAEMPFLEPEGSTVVAVLGNDFDIDGTIDPASFQIVGDPVGGTLVVTGDGVILFTPFVDVAGPHRFAYTVADIEGLSSAPLTVDMTVNAKPIATADSGGTFAGESVMMDVAANDSDADGLDLTSVVIVSPPENGQATPQDNGTVLYVPNPGFTGVDSFSYQINDGVGRTSTAAMATIHVVASRLQNPRNFADVNADGRVTAIDALLIINHLRNMGNVSEVPVGDSDRGPNYYDVSGNQMITAADALRVVNALRTASGEPEAGPVFRSGLDPGSSDYTPSLPVVTIALSAHVQDDQTDSDLAIIVPSEPTKVVSTANQPPVSRDLIETIALRRSLDEDADEDVAAIRKAIDAVMASLL